jgi:hypothetical protein
MPYEHVLTYRKNKHISEDGEDQNVKSTIGGHWMNLSCLLRRPDHATLPSTLCTWVSVQEMDNHDLVREEH